MTIDEYVRKIAREIFSNPHAYREILNRATSVIDNSNITPSSKQAFWVKLYNELGGDLNVANESQDSAELWKLIADAKSAIAIKSQKGR
jgi:hypothetical protein